MPKGLTISDWFLGVVNNAML